MTTEVYRAADWNLMRPGPGGAPDDDAAILTTVAGARDLIAWGRGNAVWPMTFGLACCAIEMMAFAGTRYDVDRLGSGAFRATPRQADLMITAGTVTYKMAHRVRRLWEQMAAPKWVIAMGACTVGGGPYSKFGYHVVQGVDLVVPVDVHIPGCPPRPEALIDALMKLQELIKRRGSIEQQAAIAGAIREGQKDLMAGQLPGKGAPGAAAAAPGGAAKPAVPRITISAPAKPPSLTAPSAGKPPAAAGGLKAPPGPGYKPTMPKPFVKGATPAPAAPAPAVEPVTAEAPAPSPGEVPAAASAAGTSKKPTGPKPPGVKSGAKPFGAPQPYVPVHKR